MGWRRNHVALSSGRRVR